MFDLSQLRCFTAVAAELNFRRAAERLHMTQPPLSRQIRLLEHQLGVVLFERNTRSVVLTAAGRAFLAEARSLLERAERATLTARRIAAGEVGGVALGFVANAMYSLLPRVVGELRRHQPELQLSLQEMTTFDLQDALLSRRIDLAICRSPLQVPGLRSERLLREPFVLAVPLAHPLASRTTLAIADLDHQDFLLYAHTAWQPFNELLSGLFRATRITPRVVQTLGSTLAILALVNEGMGLALVPRGAAALRYDGLCFRELALPEGTDSELHLIGPEPEHNPACTAVRAALFTAAERETPLLSARLQGR